MSTLIRLFAVAAVTMLACASPPVSSGTPDASSTVEPDAGPGDAGSDQDAGSETDGGSDDAGTDAGASDAGMEVPRSYRVHIVAPPGTDAFAVPLGMTSNGTVVGYAGAEAWDPLARAAKVPGNSGPAEFLDGQERDRGFAYGGSSEIVVGTYSQRPYVWSARGGSFLPVPDGFFSGAAYGVDGDGTIVGSWADSDDALPPNPIGPRPCVWIGEPLTATPLAHLEQDGVLGAALAVNSSGQIAGYAAGVNGAVAVVWENYSSQPEPIPFAVDAILMEGRAISSTGDVVAGRVSYADFSSRAFRYTRSTGALEPLPFHPNKVLSYAEGLGVNRWGHVVGTASAGPGLAHAVLWDAEGIVDLNTRVVSMPSTVSHLSSAVAIGDDGRIAAEAVMTTGFGDSIRHIAILEPDDP